MEISIGRWAALGAAGFTGLIGVFITPWRAALDPDAAVFAVLGRLIREGGVLYRDGGNGKPPVLFLANALTGWLADLIGAGDAVGLVSSPSLQPS